MSAIATKRYVDLDVFIESTPTGYVARLESEGGGQAQAQFEPPFSQDELEIFLIRLTRARRVMRRIDTPQLEAAKAFGHDLFEALFIGELRACLRASYDDATRRDKGLRIRIHPVSAPELADVPWEFLFHGTLNRFLSLSTETPIVRFLDLPEAVRPLKVTLPLKVLVAIAGPEDLTELDVDEEWRRLQEAVADLESQGVIALRRLDHASLGDLQHALRRDEYHIFHFVGHGGFDERLQDGILMMEDPHRRGVAVGAQRLGTLLHDHRSLRLAVLNACEGARTDATDPFAGVAQTLIQQGLAAVIAMQFEFTDAAAIMLAREFYGALADGYPIDAALAEGRKAIFNAGNDTEWATPVLHLRCSDGLLFELQPPGHAPLTPAHVPVAVERREALPLPSSAPEEDGREPITAELPRTASELPEITKVLIVVAGPAAGEMIPFVDELRLGRAEGDRGDLAGDPLLSRHHAVLREAPDGPSTIEDLGSANGTFVNGERTHGSHPVRVGDMIKVGNSTLRLSEDVGETTAHSQERKPREPARDEGAGGGEVEETGSIEQIEGE